MASNTELLIEFVQKYPVLYDTSHPDYKNNKMKNKIWDTIASLYGESDGDTLKKQWKNLRDSYSKHLRSCKRSTGQESKFIDRYKTWPWAELMAFLRPHLEFAEAHSNIQRNAEEVSTSQSKNITTSQCLPNRSSHLSLTQQNDTPRRMRRRRKRTSDQTQSQVDNKVKNVLSLNTNTEDDDTDLLFKSYSMKLKKMTTRRQATVKFEIAKIMLQAELEESDEMQSKLDAGQHLEDNMLMLVKPHASRAGSDTKESTYSVSSPHLAIKTEIDEPLSPPSPSYIQPTYTGPSYHNT